MTKIACIQLTILLVICETVISKPKQDTVCLKRIPYKDFHLPPENGPIPFKISLSPNDNQADWISLPKIIFWRFDRDCYLMAKSLFVPKTHKYIFLNRQDCFELIGPAPDCAELAKEERRLRKYKEDLMKGPNTNAELEMKNRPHQRVFNRQERENKRIFPRKNLMI